MKRQGLILEGGATRGVFTAGVLDYLMEQEYYFPYVVGVSAGSCNAIDYVFPAEGTYQGVHDRPGKTVQLSE